MTIHARRIALVLVLGCAACGGRAADAPDQDGGADGPAGSGACVMRAADYDQSCVEDSDCVGVPDGDLCASPDTCTNCTGAAVNAAVADQYWADLGRVVPHPSLCPCPNVAVACNGGVCGLAGAGAPAAAGLCPEVSGGGGSCPVTNYHDPLVSYVELSSLVFRGTVTALHAATPGINVTDTSRTVIVHVDELLVGLGTLDVRGQDVTVELLAAPTMAVGYEGYFFTQLWAVGQSVGVLEVAHLDPGVDPTIEDDVPGIEQLLADERLHARMATAATVVVGTVTAVTGLPATGGSEHDPLWAAATIEVDCALSGSATTTVTAAFATSDDVAWAASPKLAVGEAGVFLLQPVPAPAGPFPVPGTIAYLVTDPLDAQPASARAHVATLVLCPPTR